MTRIISTIIRSAIVIYLAVGMALRGLRENSR
jgi:hypothetical protein